MGADFVAHLLELDRGTFTLLNDHVIDDFGGIHVRADGIWQARFAEDVIRHYSRDLALIETCRWRPVSQDFLGRLR